MEFVDKLTVYHQMIELWTRKLQWENVCMSALACKHLEEQKMSLSIFSGLISEYLQFAYTIFVITFQKQRPIAIHSWAIHSLPYLPTIQGSLDYPGI